MNTHIRTLISVLIVMTMTLLSAEEIQAGGNVTVTGSYEYYLPPDVSEKVGRTRALEQARLQALANAFGTFLSSTTAMNQREDSSGASESFNVFSTADVAGVWMKTIEERVERRVVGDDIVLEAYVKGQARAREISSVEYDVEVGRVDDSERFIPASRFKDRERFDIRFVTPEAGYVAIYASDGVNDACRLLPEASANLAQPVRVERGEEYRFFEDSNPVMSLGPEEESAILRITILFQPESGAKPFRLPVDSSRVDSHGDVLGWSIGNGAYQTWLAKSLNDKSMQRRDINVTITK